MPKLRDTLKKLIFHLEQMENLLFLGVPMLKHITVYSFRNTPLSSIGINIQDSVVVSCEKPSWIAVCTGFVHEISSTEMQLLIDRYKCVNFESIQSENRLISKQHGSR